MAFTWPLVLHLPSVLPHDLGDPILSTYLLWWNAHVVPLTSAWWNPPLFWPLTGALARSETLLGLSVLATPLQWIGAAPVTTHNILFLLSFPLSAIAAYGLALVLTRRHSAAAIAGLIFGFNPYRTSQFAHLQMMWACWMPVALAALHRYREDGRSRWLVAFGLAWIGLGLSNGYYLLFFCVLASMWIGWFFSARQDRSRLMRLLAAWAIAATLITPVIIGYHTALDAFRGERTLTEIRSFSADVSAFAATSPLVWAWRRLSVVHQAEQQLFPGIVSIVLFAAALVIIPRGDRVSEAARRARIAIVIVATTVVTLAVVAAVGGPIRTRLLTIDSISKPGAIVIWLTVVAIALGSRARRAFATRSPLAFYVIATVVMFVLALGPEPTLNGTPIWYKPPYAWLIELPGFGVIRVAARFAMLGELCLAVVAALAWAAMTRDLRPRYLTLATAGCVAVLLADSWVVGLPLPAVPPRLDALEAIAGGTPVLELPVGVLEDTAAMYRAMFHGAPLVNGYSGFTPAHYDILRAALDAGDPAVLDAFASRRDLIVVVNESPAKRWTEYFGHADAAERLTGDSAHAIFRLRASPWRAPALGAPIPIVSIDDVPSSGLQQLSDNNLLTRWDSGAPQHGHEVITLDLGRPQRVGGVELSAGPYLGEVARRLTVQLSVDHDAWSSVAIASSFARAVDSAIRDPKRIAMVFDFPARAARYIRLRQTGVDSTYHWSIAELLVFAAE